MQWMLIQYERQTQKLKNRSIDKRDVALNAPCKDILLKTTLKGSNNPKSTKPLAAWSMIDQLLRPMTAISAL